jgi:hypothetical protein
MKRKNLAFLLSGLIGATFGYGLNYCISRLDESSEIKTEQSERIKDSDKRSEIYNPGANYRKFSSVFVGVIGAGLGIYVVQRHYRTLESKG